MQARAELATVVLLRDGTEISSWPLRAEGRVSLAVIDHLARLRVAARRRGCTILLHQLAPGLAEVIDLVGLDQVLSRCPCPPAASGIEVVRETEDGEDRGVEEVVVPDDPVA